MILRPYAKLKGCRSTTTTTRPARRSTHPTSTPVPGACVHLTTPNSGFVFSALNDPDMRRARSALPPADEAAAMDWVKRAVQARVKGAVRAVGAAGARQRQSDRDDRAAGRRSHGGRSRGARRRRLGRVHRAVDIARNFVRGVVRITASGGHQQHRNPDEHDRRATPPMSSALSHARPLALTTTTETILGRCKGVGQQTPARVKLRCTCHALRTPRSGQVVCSARGLGGLARFRSIR